MQTVRFVDCRWELGNPELGRELYLAGHIPGAAFLDVEQELSAPPVAGGARHPLPSADAFSEAAGRAGIGPRVVVAAYGSMGGAERLWWLLRHFGHDDVAVLADGIDSWLGPLIPAPSRPSRSSRCGGALGARSGTATFACSSRATVSAAALSGPRALDRH